jgi:hypothetical protein
MAAYSLAVRTTNVTIANPCFEIRTGSGDRPRIFEIGLTINAATASVFGLGRPQAIGITPTSPVDMLPEDPGEPGSTTFETALAWGTAPTVPLAFLRRVSLPATIGAGIVWQFPQGLIIPVSSSLVVWNITAVSVADIWIAGDL